MDELLIDYVRRIGITCGSIHAGHHVGWTTDPDKARLAGEHGARLTHYTARTPDASGWEVSFRRDSRVVTAENPA